MILTLCALAAAQAFPEAPIQSELLRGAKVFSEKKGIERTWMEDRKGFGTWFDGKVRRETDYALKLTPGLMCRWLGYLAAKEKWPPEKLAESWAKIREELGGNHWFVVRISAFPKLDLFDGSPSDSVNPSTLDSIRFQITFNGPRLPRSKTFDPIFGYVPTQEGISETPEGVIYASSQVEKGPTVQTRHWKEIGDLSWVETSRMASVLLPEFYEPKVAGGLPLGDYHARWYMVWTPIVEGKTPPETIDLWIFRPTKQSMVSWDLTSKKPVHKPQLPAPKSRPELGNPGR